MTCFAVDKPEMDLECPHSVCQEFPLFIAHFPEVSCVFNYSDLHVPFYLASAMSCHWCVFLIVSMCSEFIPWLPFLFIPPVYLPCCQVLTLLSCNSKRYFPDSESRRAFPGFDPCWLFLFDTVCLWFDPWPLTLTTIGGLAWINHIHILHIASWLLYMHVKAWVVWNAFKPLQVPSPFANHGQIKT